MDAELIVMLGGFLIVGLMVGFAFGVAWERRRWDEPGPPVCADTGAPKWPGNCWNVRCQLGGTCCRTDGMEGRKQCWECKAIEPNPHKPGCAYSVQQFQAPEWDDPACREAQMVVIERDANGKPTVWCDPEIADLIRALNSGGVPTEASCSGHGEKPGWIALKDGRQLAIVADLDSFKRLIGAGTNGVPAGSNAGIPASPVGVPEGYASARNFPGADEPGAVGVNPSHGSLAGQRQEGGNAN